MSLEYPTTQFYSITKRIIANKARKFLCTGTKEDLINKFLQEKIIDSSTVPNTKVIRTATLSVSSSSSSLKFQDEQVKKLINNKPAPIPVLTAKDNKTSKILHYKKIKKNYDDDDEDDEDNADNDINKLILPKYSETSLILNDSDNLTKKLQKNLLEIDTG